MTLQDFRILAATTIATTGSLAKGIQAVNELLIRHKIIIQFVSGKKLEAIPLWIEAYYSDKLRKTSGNPCHCAPEQFGNHNRQDLYIHHVYRGGCDIVLSICPGIAYSVLLKACRIDNEIMGQIDTSKVLEGAGEVKSMELVKCYRGKILVTRRVLPKSGKYSKVEKGALYAAAHYYGSFKKCKSSGIPIYTGSPSYAYKQTKVKAKEYYLSSSKSIV